MPVKEIAQFSVSHLSVLDDKGDVDADLEPSLSDDELRELFRVMVRAREADQRMLKLQRQGRLGTFPPCTGHEASSCGAALAMGPRDWLVGSYRELGARMMRGDPLLNWLLYYNGFEEGNTVSADKRILPTQVILGSQLPHAVGLAYAARLRGEKDTAVLAFMGDGATSQGDFHEALNFAAVWKMPVVFVCQNNQWAISVPREIQTASQTIAQKAVAYGMPGVQVDGNDVLAVYRAASEAFDRARAGEGPTFIEAITYRLMMHTTADDPTKYRDPDEEKEWWDKEPLIRFGIYLEQKGILSTDDQASLVEEVRAEVDTQVKAMEATELTRPDAAFDQVFETTTPELERQRAAFLTNIKAQG